MAGINEYSKTPSENTSINGINIAEGCLPGNVNDGMRQQMADTLSAHTYIKVTTGQLMVNTQRYLADTTAASFTLTLPGNPDIGDCVAVRDAGDWSVNPLTIGRNGKSIDDVNEDLELNTKGAVYEFVWDGSTWEYTPVFTDSAQLGGDNTFTGENTFGGNVTIEGTLDVNNNTTIDGTVDITGDTTIGPDGVTVTGHSTIIGSASVVGDFGITGTTHFDGDALPETPDVHDLGASDAYWLDGFIKNMYMEKMYVDGYLIDTVSNSHSLGENSPTTLSTQEAIKAYVDNSEALLPKANTWTGNTNTFNHQIIQKQPVRFQGSQSGNFGNGQRVGYSLVWNPGGGTWSNNYYYAPIAGHYYCTATALVITAAAGTQGEIGFLKNGATQFGHGGRFYSGQGGDQGMITIQGLVYCNAGEFLEVICNNTTGGSYVAGGYGALTIEYVGEN